jgi:hypothetical protein
MPLTTYTAGEVLTAASLNANLSFAASNPLGGLTFITGAAFSAVTSVSLPDDTFDSTYRNYRIIFDADVNTSNSTYTLRYRASGSDNTTSNYFQSSVGIDHTGASVNLAQNAATSFTLAATISAKPWSLVLDIFGPKLTLETRAVGFVSFIGSVSGTAESREVGLWFNATTAFDALTIISSTATNVTGAYRVYGYADS